MPEAAVFSLNIMTAQAVGALLLAALFLYFARSYQHRYLWSWTYAWGLQSVSLIASTVAMWMVFQSHGAPSLSRTVISAISLGSSYAALAFLILGTYQALSDEERSLRLTWAFVGGAAAFGVVTALIAAHDPDGMAIRLMLRLGLRSAIQGTVLVVSGVLLWRGQDEGRRGRRFVAIGFLVYGALHLHATLLFLLPWVGIDADLSYANYQALFDLIAYTMIGLGMVIWLLDQERRRRRAARGELRVATTTDPLTSLPNRARFNDSLLREIDRANSRGEHLAVCLIDLDRFRVINETLGRAGGDAVLIEAAARISAAAGDHGFAARVGDDEFAAICAGAGDVHEAVAAAERLREVFREPFRLWEREVILHASFGVAVFPNDGHDPDTLAHKASIALTQVRKRGGESMMMVYADDMVAPTADDLDFEQDLRRAAERNELVLLYQPIVRLADRRIVGAEALIRWKRHGTEIMRPDHFLPRAEALGLMEEIDLWVLSQATRTAAEWAASHSEGFRLCVNLSATTFQHPQLIAHVEQVLKRSGLPPRALELEITEHSAMHDLDTGRANIDGLRDLGVAVCIDDFGTGYSSIGHLRDLPVERVKVDRSFVARALRDERDGAVVGAVVSLATSLDLAIVAEGVEGEEQAVFLDDLGIEELQGYLFHRPLNPDDLLSLLEMQGPYQPLQ